jgi:FtsZ-interacting cell division protein ZipA
LSRTPAPGGLGTGTPGTWAQTGANLDGALDKLPKKSNAPLFIGVAVVGLLLGGGGIAAMKMSGDSETEKKLADVRATEKATQEAAARASEAKVEEQRLRASTAEQETSKVQAEAEKAKAEAEKAKVIASQALASAQALNKPPPVVAARPAARPAAKATAAPKEAPKPASTTGSGRKIRTSL